MWDQLDTTISDFIVNQLFLNMFRASLRPSSGGQTAFSLSNITTVTTGQITICSENAVWPPEDGRKDARNMLRNNWLTIKSLIVVSSWSHIYLLIKDARSLEHKVFQYCLCVISFIEVVYVLWFLSDKYCPPLYTATRPCETMLTRSAIGSMLRYISEL